MIKLKKKKKSKQNLKMFTEEKCTSYVPSCN